MRIAPWLVVVAVAVGAPRVAEAGNAGIIIPPLAVDVGRASIETDRGTANVSHTRIGLSWASLCPCKSPIDVSVGWVFVGRAPDTSVEARMVEGEDAEEEASDHGVFVGLDVRVAQGKHWRAWAGGRSEALRVDEHTVRGGFGRVSAELWLPAAVGDRGLAVIGTVALTAWAELGQRERPDGTWSTTAAAGLGVRVPFIAAFN